MKLRYGMNPHQANAELIQPDSAPLTILNGTPGYINILDALNSWQMVRELKEVTGIAAAASFKHVNPAGAAVGKPLSGKLKQAYMVADMELSPTATAYARARGTDRMASFGDFAAFSDTVDIRSAELLKRDVSDGVIAPGYDPEALDILKRKKKGKFVVLQMDPAFRPEPWETREIFGFVLKQNSNTLNISEELLKNIVTKNRNIPEERKIDMLVGLVVQKYTQSNSVNICFDGQTIGVGAGQQSRVRCTKLAMEKARAWLLRQSDKVLNIDFPEGFTRNDKDNYILKFLEDNASGQIQDEQLRKTAAGWVMVSDGFIPFRDNIDILREMNIRYVVQPGESARDDKIIEVCNEYGMVMIFTGKRLFHH